MAERQPISMEGVLGTKVLIHLHREAYEMLSVQGIESERFLAMVLGLDSFGLWIEDPSYCTIPVYDDNGNYIPPEQRVEVCHRAAVLIQWGFIQTILQFPDRMTYRPSANETEFGFRRHLVELSGPGPKVNAPEGAGKIKVPVQAPPPSLGGGAPGGGSKNMAALKKAAPAKGGKEKKRG